MTRARLARIVLRPFVHADRLDEVVEALLEADDARRQTRAAGSRLWFARQLFAFVVLTGPERVGDGLASMTGLASGSVSHIRLALRRIRLHPGRTVVVGLTLGVGIGAVSLAAGAVHANLFAPLPYRAPDQLYAVRVDHQGNSWWSASAAEARAWHSDAQSIAGIGWASSGGATVRVGGEPARVRVTMVSADLLDVLGVAVGEGRNFEALEAEDGGPAAVILTAAFVHRYGSVLPPGSTLIVDDVPRTVVGVLGPDAELPFEPPAELLLPQVLRGTGFAAQGRLLQAIVRVLPGHAPDDVAAELHGIMGRLGIASFDTGWTPRLVPLRDEVVGDRRFALMAALAAAACILLVCILNMSGLVLASSQDRASEAVVRRMLGASRSDVLVQALMESLVPAAIGGLIGVMLAAAAGDIAKVVGFDTIDIPEPGTATWLVALAGTLIAAAAFALATGTFATGRRLLASGLRITTQSRSGSKVSDLILAGEIGATFVLIVAAYMATLSLRALRDVDPGVSLDDAVVLEIALPPGAYPDRAARLEAVRELRTRIDGVPGVIGTGSVTNLPFDGPGWVAFHVVESQPLPAPGEEPTGAIEMVSAGYFEAAGIPLVHGRIFQDADTAAEATAVVNQAMADFYWHERSPLGDRIRYGPAGSNMWVRVVGVVGDVRYALHQPPAPRLYLPERLTFNARPTSTIVIRTRRSLRDIGANLRASVDAVTPGSPVVRLATMRQIATETLTSARMQATLLALLATTALLLAIVGIYGAVSLQVSRRTREVGLRMAVGATGAHVVRQIVGRMLLPVTAGLAIGVAGAVALAGLWRRLLFDVNTADPRILASLALILAATAALAAAVPATRAAHIHPVRALSSD